ncbi:MAG: [Fe-Fe] hydrogenase large subunit C-terminal domain-containing protein [Bacillota bacterium]|nr:[Fe-Fe] hydrogenase large subunit C-terminal domain-containing protein [Bacillota bacterium]
MAVVTTIGRKCRRCYTCIRHCPARAIKVEGGQAQVVAELCIACGTCLRVCRQQAKKMESHVEMAREVLREDGAAAILAPSYVVNYWQVSPGQVATALRLLGFETVAEVAYGAELVALAYLRLLVGRPVFARAGSGAAGAERCGDGSTGAAGAGGDGDGPTRAAGCGDGPTGAARPLISTACPAVVNLVEVHYPELIPWLAHVVSPMVALARYLKHYGRARSVVFVGPCVAKKDEIRHPGLAGAVDAVLTFPELDEMLAGRGIVPADLPPGGFDPPHPRLGRCFPLSGGLLRTASLHADPLHPTVMAVDGRDRVLRKLGRLRHSQFRPVLLDLLFCEGCIDGPLIDPTITLTERRKRLADHVLAGCGEEPELAAADAVLGEVDLSRSFQDRHLAQPVPSEEEIRRILALTRKYRPEDELDCGACGYATCRDKALAVWRGVAEAEMCLPYMIEELEQSVRELARSHQELEESHLQLQRMQEHLIQSEKMASLGQLSAGVAHELNNPLGGILLFAGSLLEELPSGDPRRREIELIRKEAQRCRDIVRNLLNFARQTRLRKQQVNLADLLREVMEVMAPHIPPGVTVRQELNELPPVWLDPGEMKQVFTNVISNAIEAMPDGGTLTIRAGRAPEGVTVCLADTGCGILPEHLNHIFQPFFTTKPIGKGTGLGLATAYGIVKMHGGDITVRSQVGVGTEVEILLPLGESEAVSVLTPERPGSAGALTGGVGL